MSSANARALAQHLSPLSPAGSLCAGLLSITEIQYHPASKVIFGVPLQLKTPLACSSHQVWQAVRASSAAPYYLDDFRCGSDRQLFP